MTEIDYEQKQVELDRLLNDPDVPMHADRVWALLDELSRTSSFEPVRLAA
jgi:hypothetical protein